MSDKKRGRKVLADALLKATKTGKKVTIDTPSVDDVYDFVRGLSEEAQKRKRKFEQQ